MTTTTTVRNWLRARVATRVLIWGTLLALLGLGLCFVPLFNLLGFDYAFALGLLVGPAAVDIGHGVGARLRGQIAFADGVSGAAKLTWRLAATSWINTLAVLVAPLLFSLLTALWVRNCDLRAGLTFYALLPVASAIFAAPIGAMVGFGLPRPRGRLVAVALVVASIAWTVVRLYVDPPVFALDPFGGYFPGPIYDEAMQPPARLFAYRGANLVWLSSVLLAFAAVLSARRAGWRRALTPIALAAVATSVSLWIFQNRAAHGFHVDGDHLRRVLRRETTSAHFRVHTDPASDGTAQDRAVFLRDLEFRYDQLGATLGATPRGPIAVYLFPSAQMKKDLVGAGGTLYAKPWTREIFLQADRFPLRNLRHEMAHVFAGAFGDPLFGIALRWRLPVPRLSGGLVEGIAEAADYGDPDGRATVHQDARAMIDAGLSPPLEKVVGAGFSTLSGARAYTIAGSFTHYLLSTGGAEKLRAIYHSGGDFEGVYGRPLAALEADWRAFVAAQPLDRQDEARAKERYRRPAIFQKVCARDIAARIDAARGHLYSLPEEAAAIFAGICADDPAEPSHRLNLADAYAAAGDRARALAITDDIERDEAITTPLRARAATLAASVHFHAGAIDAARAATDRAGALATEEGEQRNAVARRRALADSLAQKTLGRILFGDSPTRGVDGALTIYLAQRFAAANPDEAIGAYLLGRQLSFRDAALAIDPLTAACPTDEGGASATWRDPLSPAFRTECLRLLGDAAFRTRALDISQAAWRRLRDDATTEADRLRAQDFLDRLAWEERHRTP